MSTLNFNKDSFSIDNLSWASVDAAKLPEKSEENWRYLKWGKLKKINFHGDFKNYLSNLDDLDLPQLDGYTIVIENGVFNDKLSHIPAYLDGLEFSFTKNNSVVKEDSYFDVLNTCFVNKSVNIRTVANAIIKEPINIVNVITSSEGFVNTNTHLYLSTNSSLILNEFYLASDKTTNGLTNHQCSISIEKEAKLVLNRYQYPNHNFQICKDVILQEEDSYYTSNNFSSSGILVRNDVRVKVSGENCHTELNGIFTPSSNEFIDNHTLIDHAAPNCKSFENYKGLIKSNGIGVFNGKVIVEKDAQRIEAFQQNNNILIHDDSTVYSKPELEIYADDVKCSHGSTTGQFDDEALFYLRSRGLSQDAAMEYLTLGFVHEILDCFKNSNHREFILKKFLLN